VTCFTLQTQEVVLPTSEMKREGEYARVKVVCLRLCACVCVCRTIAEQLKTGVHAAPEIYEAVSVLFSAISDFTELATVSSPLDIVNVLNDLYGIIDDAIQRFDVYKVIVTALCYSAVVVQQYVYFDKQQDQVHWSGCKMLRCIMLSLYRRGVAVCR
jgi:hypothetical protein